MNKIEIGSSEARTEKTPSKVVELFDQRFFVPISITTPPDRHGSIGYVDFDVDWRPKQYEVNYVFQPNNDDRKLNYFDDDHRRAISKVLGTGSRDQRVFSLQDQKNHERREKRKSILEKELKRLEAFLQKELPPVRILIQKEAVKLGGQFRDVEGKMQDDSSMVDKYSWREYSDLGGRVSEGHILYSKVLDAADQQLDEEGLREHLAQGNQVATSSFRERMENLLKKELMKDVVDALAKRQRILDELGLFNSTYLINVPVLLAPANVRNPVFGPSVASNGGLYEGVSPSVYTPQSSPDRLENYGSGGTRTWYELQGIDISEPVISFPIISSGSVLVPSLFELRAGRAGGETIKEKNGPVLPKKERSFVGVSEAVEAPIVKTEKVLELPKSKQAELPTEVLEGISTSLERASALLCIIEKGLIGSNPFSIVERELQKKISARNQRLEALHAELKSGMIRLEAKEEVESLYKKALELVQQKAVAQARPGFGKAVQEKIVIWEAIPNAVLNSSNCQMLLEEGVRTPADLVRAVREQYLKDSWNQSIESCIEQVVTRVIDEIPQE
ncbi:MAG: hypothetical protein WCK01_04000 [Candidatus Uhrbacteria bacterium]